MRTPNCFLFLIVLVLNFSCKSIFTGSTENVTIIPDESMRGEHGIRFNCSAKRLMHLPDAFMQYMQEQKIAAYVEMKKPEGKDWVQFALKNDGKTAVDSTSTFDLGKTYGIPTEQFSFTTKSGKTIHSKIPARAEIILSLLQKGRLTVFQADECGIEKFREYIDLRHSITKWGSVADFYFPYSDGKGEYFDPDFWMTWDGDPNMPKVGEYAHEVRNGQSVAAAVYDVFYNDDRDAKGFKKYRFDCLVAAKLIMVQGMMDYYQNYFNDRSVIARLEKEIQNKPLENVDPVVYYDREHPEKSEVYQGRFLDRHLNVAADNWVAGDWGYFRNPDEKSRKIHGNQGANIIYGGLGEFTRYFLFPQRWNLEQCIQYVFHWQFEATGESGVAKIDAPVATPAQVAALMKDPDEGGMVRDVRDGPKIQSAPLID